MTEGPRTDPADCPHPRVEAHLPATRPGSASGAHATGYHVAQGGTCHACRAPVLRFVDLPPQGPARCSPWVAVHAHPDRRRQQRAA